MPVAVFATEANPASDNSECVCETACADSGLNQDCAACEADIANCAGSTKQGAEEPTATEEDKYLLVPRITAESKSYDATTNVTYSLEFEGLLEGESLGSDDYTVSASFDDANAGENKEVTAYVSLNNTDAAQKYLLTSGTATTTATISKVTLTAVCTVQDKVYDGKDSANISVRFEGLPSGVELTEDDYSVSGYFMGSDAGVDIPVFITVRLSGEAANNFELVSGDVIVKASITQAPQETPNPYSAVLVSYMKESIGFDERYYELNTSPTFDGDFILGGDPITPGQVFYVRAKGDENHEPSEAAKYVVDARPAAPTGITATAETNRGASDGTIAGLTKSMEYKLEGATEWTEVAEETLTSLVPGTYLVRYQVGDDTFASEDVSVVIAPSYTSTETKEDGTVVVTTYNEKGEVTKLVETDAAGNSTITEYNENGTVVVTNYNEKGELTKKVETDTAGNITITDYNEDGTKVEIKRDSEGNITQERTYAPNGSYVQKGFEPEMVEGANAVFTHAEDALTFRSNDEFINFLKVLVDGVEIDPANYTAVSGSIKVSLEKVYLETLSAGTHTMEIVSTNGSAGTSFTVQAKQDTTPSNGTTNPSAGSNNDSASNDNTTNSDSNDTSSTESASSNDSTASASATATSLSATSDTLPLALCIALLLVATGSLVVLICGKKKRLQ
jgi:hypothetical protein